MEKENNFDELPSHRKLKEDISNLGKLAELYNLSKIFGFRDEKLDSELEKLKELKDGVERLSKLPFEFNNLFSELGWIAYDSLDTKVMEKCIETAKTAGINDAEQLLIDHYDGENLRLKMIGLRGLSAFKERMELLHLAYSDHIEGRFHASIPVLLMMIDGVVNDIRQKGFFATNTDLSAWDSIAAHDKGLKIIADIFSTKRNKTTSEEINIPYRNGILHGRDLGYANKIISSKCWSTLFCVGDFAKAVRDEEKKKEEYISSTKPKNLQQIWASLLDSSEVLKKNKETRTRSEDWIPREISLGDKIPSSGEEEDYQLTSPERVVAKFTKLWRDKNYGKLTTIISKRLSGGDSTSKRAGRIRKILADKSPVTFEIKSIIDEAPAISQIEVRFFVNKGESIVEQEHTFRLIYQNEEGNPFVRGDTDGSWFMVDNIYPMIEW